MTGTTLLPQAVYRRASDPDQLPKELRLKALEWALYFGVTGEHTCAELARRMRVEIAEVDHALTRLLSLRLVQEQELDAAQYVSALAASGDPEEKTLREFLMGAARPAAGASGVAERPAAPAPAPLTASMHRDVARDIEPRPAERSPSRTKDGAGTNRGAAATTLRPGRTVRPAFGFNPLPLPNDDSKENRPMTGSRKLSLRALMDLIQSQAVNSEAGQLDIYRVFVRVDTTLLKRNGIETLRFTEDRLVSDPELEQALVWSLKKTLNINCPEEVWVEVA